MIDNKAMKAKIQLVNKRISAIQNSGNKSLDYVLKNIKLLSGKRFRALLVLLTAEANGAKTDGTTLDIAVAIELLHHATLIHDDIVDKADKRRGEEALNRKIGAALSVLSGDYLFSTAMQAILKTKDQELFDIFARSIKSVCEGEIEEVYYKNDATLTTHECLNIIKNKTAALISGSVQAGAHAGKCSKDVIKHLTAFGENLGMAFQIKDDLLDIVSTSGKLGKTTGNDIKEGKATLPLVLALNNATKKESDRIKKIFAAETAAVNSAKILDFINTYDGVNQAELMALSFVVDAKAALDKAKLKDEKKKELLYQIADYVVEREY
jgi:octaprenyl-diphosphate synthase